MSPHIVHFSAVRAVPRSWARRVSPGQPLVQEPGRERVSGPDAVRHDVETVQSRRTVRAASCRPCPSASGSSPCPSQSGTSSPSTRGSPARCSACSCIPSSAGSGAGRRSEASSGRAPAAPRPLSASAAPRISICTFTRLRSAVDAIATGRRAARVEGFSLHADVAVPARRLHRAAPRSFSPAGGDHQRSAPLVLRLWRARWPFPWGRSCRCRGRKHASPAPSSRKPVAVTFPA